MTNKINTTQIKQCQYSNNTKQRNTDSNMYTTEVKTNQTRLEVCDRLTDAPPNG